MDRTQILKKPWLTEKTTRQLEEGKYVFVVDKRATKKEIAQAVEQVFKVETAGIQIIRRRGKKRRNVKTKKEVSQPDWKKAIIKLKKDQKIDLFEQK